MENESIVRSKYNNIHIRYFRFWLIFYFIPTYICTYVGIRCKSLILTMFTISPVFNLGGYDYTTNSRLQNNPISTVNSNFGGLIYSSRSSTSQYCIGNYDPTANRGLHKRYNHDTMSPYTVHPSMRNLQDAFFFFSTVRLRLDL